mgnify:CR=1 FL=1
MKEDSHVEAGTGSSYEPGLRSACGGMENARLAAGFHAVYSPTGIGNSLRLRQILRITRERCSAKSAFPQSRDYPTLAVPRCDWYGTDHPIV